MFSLISIALFVVFLAILIIGHEFGHFLAAKLFQRKVEEFAFGFPPRLFSKKLGETTYSFNLIPFGGFVRIYGEAPAEQDVIEPERDRHRSFRALGPFKKSVVLVAGAAMNFLIGWLTLSIVFMVGVPSTVFVQQVMPGTPAEAVGLTVGDRILGFATTEEFTQFVNVHKGEELTIELLRNGEEMKLSVTPRINPPEGEGSLGVVIAQGEIPKHGVVSALVEGFKFAFNTTLGIINAAVSLISSFLIGDEIALQQVTGPLGLLPILGAASKLGVVYLLHLLALISLNLAVINIIPFPALDGGRLLFTLFEKILGRPLGYRFETVANMIGFALLLFLMVAITIKDITNLSS